MNTTSIKLSNTHIKIYKFIKGYIEKNDFAPSYREISKECDISLSHCHKLVSELKVLGYVKGVGGKCRAIRIS